VEQQQNTTRQPAEGKFNHISRLGLAAQVDDIQQFTVLK
jgi:hypothetical protein